MNLDEFISAFAEQFDEIEPDEIHADSEYQEFEEWSSLTAMGIIAMTKTQYGKTITGREIRSCKTVEDLFNLIESK